MGIDRKVKRGMCWYPVSTGRSYYNSLNQLVIEMERQEDKEIEHVFEFGRPVCFSLQDAPGNIHYFNFTATVNYVDETAWSSFCHRQTLYSAYRQPSVSWGFNFILMKPVTD